MRAVDPCDLQRMVSIKGIVIRCSDLIPNMNLAHFACTTEECEQLHTVQITHNRIFAEDCAMGVWVGVGTALSFFLSVACEGGNFSLQLSDDGRFQVSPATSTNDS